MNERLLPASHLRTADTVLPTDEEWLRSFLPDLAVKGMPSPVVRPPDPQVPRRWAGELHADGASPACTVLRRHPDLCFAFQDLPELKVRRHQRGFGSGIRKEFTSSVTGREMFAFSSLEFDALRCLELDAQVADFIEQPIQIRYMRAGQRRLYRPDILALRSGRLECIEVKFEADAGGQEEKWSSVGSALASIGVGFTVLTERHLRRDPRHRNIRTVFLARHDLPTRGAAERAFDVLRTTGSMTARTLRRELGVTFRQACCLLRHGLLSADLDAAPLDEEVILTASDRGRRDIWAPRL